MGGIVLETAVVSCNVYREDERDAHDVSHGYLHDAAVSVIASHCYRVVLFIAIHLLTVVV